MDSLEKDLTDSLHLSEYQAKLYIAGLNFTYATLSDLAKSAGVPRTAAYQPLKELLDRNFVTPIKKGKRTYYSSIDPKQLLDVVEQDRARLNIAISNLSQHINAHHNDVSVRYFNGTRGVQAAADIFLDESNMTTWYAFEHPIPVLEKINEAEFESFIQRRVKKGVRVHVIIPSSSVNPWVQKRIENSKKELYDILVVSETEDPIDSSVAAGGEHVLIFSMRGTPFAILIKNRDIANTFRSMHKLIWDRYRS